MVQLERRVQILQEEKAVLTTMERRLQERCAELQRDVFRLQNVCNSDDYGTLDKHPVALPRNAATPSQPSKIGSSEQEDEGISSSDTNQSLSSDPESMLVVNVAAKETTDYDDDETVRIEDVIEELEHVVNAASRELNGYTSPSTDASTCSSSNSSDQRKEKDIVPVNLLPQPPKRSRSLVHLLSSGSEFDGSEYGMLMLPNDSGRSFCNDITSSDTKIECYARDFASSGDGGGDDAGELHKLSTNRELLDEIMDAQEKEHRLPPFITGERLKRNEKINPLLPYVDSAPQDFDGVFVMAELGASRKYARPDDAKRAGKSAERSELFDGGGIESIIDIVVTNDSKQQRLRSPYEKTVLSSFGSHNGQSGVADCSTFFIGSKALSADASHGWKPSGVKLTDLPSGLYWTENLVHRCDSIAIRFWYSNGCNIVFIFHIFY